MLGNIVTGCSVLAPAGMLAELSDGLGVTIHTAGLLITFGAIVLCVGSPVTAWLTSRIERRALLTATLLVLTLTNAASAFAPNYDSLLIIRLVMLAVGVLYTPQAAGTAALIVPVEKRGSTIAYIFLGWSLAAAIGLPLITFIASRYGFRVTYGAIALTGLVSSLLLWWRLPGGLHGAPVDLRTWVDLGRNPMVILLLSITTLQMSGQFVVFTFMGPLLAKLTGANADAVGIVFALYGIFGVRRHRDRNARGGLVGRLENLGPVHRAAARRRSRLGTERRGLRPDGRLRRGVGPRLCIDQFDAAGTPGRCGAGARFGVGLAQYLGAVYRPGHRLRDRWLAVRPRMAAQRRLRGHGLRRGGARGRNHHAAATDGCHRRSRVNGWLSRMRSREHQRSA
ncbi:hypothetical protein ABIF14_002289 [Bradyrhizobium elkanii]